MEDGELHAQFAHVLTALRDQFPRLAYVHFVEPRISGASDMTPEDDDSILFARQIWGSRDGSVFLAAGGYTLESAQETVEQHGGAIVFGRAFLANPDLPVRLFPPFADFDLRDCQGY